ncbi:hypothetical protein MLD38_009668 [Melastoma candidum]|uniref:Uncharacterized protein n=1 Tax=Melastoma candidum TaxID=119954 RepID=A0ACB9RYG3_9MYRT|nr:hypothetical protein MLD38_009668 [Melastoma candidum]
MGGRCLNRLVMVAFPLQGHITPILQLASLQHAEGFSITMFHPQFNSLPLPVSLRSNSFLCPVAFRAPSTSSR